MLVSMTIRNIALIESLQIDFQQGMHVLSGETGAGKSIIVDSINLVLGERADRGLIRSGCEKASVEALMDISDCPAVRDVLQEMELEDDNGLISIQREISISDRNICRVCGVIVPLTFLRKMSELLVDVHGQHEHQSLLDAKRHMGFMDSFGDEAFASLKEQVRESYRIWRESSSRFSKLRKENAQRVERQAYLTNRVMELDLAQIEMGESDRLAQERDRFASAEKVDSSLRGAYGLVMDGGRERSAMEKLRAAAEALSVIGPLDERYQKMSERISTCYYEAEEIGIELRSMLESENFDPARFEEVQERLDQIRRLERRYGMPADELVKHHEEIRDELTRLDSMEERLKRAEAEYKQKLSAYRQAAAKLTEARQALARRFEGLIESELWDLGMQNTRFACIFEELKPDQKKIPTPEGDDHVVFYIAPNPGEPLKPLDKTASGGELSRLMLAMKAAAADKAGVPCMIFDEIDTGISGHIAGVVAEKMASIARYHQVLCVTHLAQIAAMADRQFLVQKAVVGERTKTDVTPLDEEGRVVEIARLLGVTDRHQESGFAHARELLVSATHWKQKLSAKDR